MRSDLWTVAWKEWRSITGGRARRQVLLTGGMLLFYAVLFPLQMGSDWVSDPIPVGLLGLALPMVMVGIIVPDAIAGERERHTLATLLASRLPDRAILFGKLGFAVIAGWLGAPILLGAALLVVNIANAGGGPLFYDVGVLLGVLVLSLLLALLAGGIGIFVSLRARTTQEAQQLTVFGLMLPFMVATAAAVLLLQGDVGRSVQRWLESSGATTLVFGLMAVLAVVDGIVLWAADRRFRRGRLIGN